MILGSNYSPMANFKGYRKKKWVNFYIKMLLFYLIYSPIIYFVYSYAKVNRIHPDLEKI